MKLNFSARERRWATATAVCLVFFWYWQALLNPLVSSISRSRAEIRSVQNKLTYQRTLADLQAAGRERIEIYPKEEQLNFLLKFIDAKFRWFGIKLISLRQTAEKKELIIDLKFKSTSYQLLGFLRSLPRLGTVLIVEQARIRPEADRLVTEMRLKSAFK